MVLALLVVIGWVEVAFDPRQGIVCHPLLVDVWKIYSFHVISIENLAAKPHFYEGMPPRGARACTFIILYRAG